MGVLAFWFLSSLDHLWESERFGMSPSFLSQPWCVSITHKLLHSCSALSGLRTEVSLQASTFFRCVFSLPPSWFLQIFGRPLQLTYLLCPLTLVVKRLLIFCLTFFLMLLLNLFSLCQLNWLMSHLKKLAHVTFEDSATDLFERCFTSVIKGSRVYC